MFLFSFLIFSNFGEISFFLLQSDLLLAGFKFRSIQNQRYHWTGITIRSFNFWGNNVQRWHFLRLKRQLQLNNRAILDSSSLFLIELWADARQQTCRNFIASAQRKVISVENFRSCLGTMKRISYFFSTQSCRRKGMVSFSSQEGSFFETDTSNEG